MLLGFPSVSQKQRRGKALGPEQAQGKNQDSDNNQKTAPGLYKSAVNPDKAPTTTRIGICQ